MMPNQDPFYIPLSGNLMDLAQDDAWVRAMDEAEELFGFMSAGVPPTGWMKTWPELFTYSHFEQLRSIVLRGFMAMLQDQDLGAGHSAAFACGKPIVMERLTLPSDAVKAQLLGLMDELHFGPPLEMTEERLVGVRSVVQQVLTTEDWGAIAQAAASQVERQVMALVA
jgi:hypothetical protein